MGPVVMDIILGLYGPRDQVAVIFQYKIRVVTGDLNPQLVRRFEGMEYGL